MLLDHARCIPISRGKDRPHAKSLTRPALTVPASSLRSCTGEDLPGTWNLVTFNSSYGFKNPQAPHLFPYQVFHYSREQGAKSAHPVRRSSSTQSGV